MKWNVGQLSVFAVVVLSVFLFSCSSQPIEPTPVVVVAPPPQQTAPEPQAPPVEEKSDKELDDLLAQLDEEESKTDEPETTPETTSEDEELLEEEPEALLEPTTPRLSNSKGCRAMNAPASYEACLNGCTKLCGDISLVNCEKFEGMHEGHLYNCFGCSCS